MRVLVAGWLGSTNLGDELVFRALQAKLARRGARVAAISTRPDVTATQHRTGAVSSHAPIDLAAAVAQADAVIFGGGGLVQDETSVFNLPYHLSRVWLADLSRTPWAAVGIGAGPLRGRLGRVLARELNRARALSVRDRHSADLLASAGVHANLVAADPVVSLPVPDVGAQDRLAVSLRPWRATSSRSLPVGWRSRHEAPDWFVDSMARQLDDAARRTGLTVRFVAFQRDRDHAVHAAVARAMREPCELVAPDLNGVLDEVARARLVVAMRYHAGIAALLAGRPAVLVGYSPKVGALADELGPGGRLVAFAPDGIEQVSPALEALSGRAGAVVAARERLRERERMNDVAIDVLLEQAGPS